MNKIEHFRRLREILRIVRRYGLDAPRTRDLKFPFFATVLDIVAGKAEYDEQ